MPAPPHRFRKPARPFYAAALVCGVILCAQTPSPAQQPVERAPAEQPAPSQSAAPSASPSQANVPPANQPAGPAAQTPPAQAAPSQATPSQVTPSQAAPVAKKEGFFDAFGRLWDKSTADFKASVDQSNAKWKELGEQTQKANKDAMTATKDATDTLMKLSNTRIVEARERCDIAPNGSADCNAAAERTCRAKGFAIGKSADIQSNRKCSARAWLTGNPSESDCKIETILIKAACNN